MVSLAGAAAQKLAGYPSDKFDSEDGAAADLEHAKSGAAHLARFEAGLSLQPGPNEPRSLAPGDPLYTAATAIMNRARAKTVTMLKNKWQAVDRVAGALRKRDRLSQAELDHVINHGQRSG